MEMKAEKLKPLVKIPKMDTKKRQVNDIRVIINTEVKKRMEQLEKKVIESTNKELIKLKEQIKKEILKEVEMYEAELYELEKQTKNDKVKRSRGRPKKEISEEDKKALRREAVRKWYQSERGKQYYEKKKLRQKDVPKENKVIPKTPEEKAKMRKEYYERWYNSEKGAAFKEKMRLRYHEKKNKEK